MKQGPVGGVGGRERRGRWLPQGGGGSRVRLNPTRGKLIELRLGREHSILWVEQLGEMETGVLFFFSLTEKAAIKPYSSRRPWVDLGGWRPPGAALPETLRPGKSAHSEPMSLQLSLEWSRQSSLRSFTDRLHYSHQSRIYFSQYDGYNFSHHYRLHYRLQYSHHYSVITRLHYIESSVQSSLWVPTLHSSLQSPTIIITSTITVNSYHYNQHYSHPQESIQSPLHSVIL